RGALRRERTSTRSPAWDAARLSLARRARARILPEGGGVDARESPCALAIADSAGARKADGRRRRDRRWFFRRGGTVLRIRSVHQSGRRARLARDRGRVGPRPGRGVARGCLHDHAPLVHELQALLDGDPKASLARAARDLGLTQRSLQRRLEESGTTF